MTHNPGQARGIETCLGQRRRLVANIARFTVIVASAASLIYMLATEGQLPW